MSPTHSALYRRPVALDPALHRDRKVQPLTDFTVAAGLHAVFITAAEFPQAGLEFPLLFVATGEHDLAGRAAMSTIALLGISPGENLQLDGSRWISRYIPAYIRRYPFAIASKAASAPAAVGLDVLVDDSWPGFSEAAGEPLFGEADAPAPALVRAMDFLQRFELEAERTRAFCARVVALDVLKEMSADATLPDGRKLSVDGFHAIDEDKLHALADSVVLELYRTGVLMLMQLHLVSLANIRHLVNRKVELDAASGRPDLSARRSLRNDS
ncbi:MAG: SapC family protein [Caldimonas sp.]